MYLVIFTQFFCDFQTVCFAHPINPIGLVFYIFQGLIHIFKDDFYKIPGQFQEGTYLKFQEFSRTKVKFKDISSLCEPLSDKNDSPRAYIISNKIGYNLRSNIEIIKKTDDTHTN